MRVGRRMRRRRNIFVNSRTVELELLDSGLIFIQVYAIQNGIRNAYIFHTGSGVGLGELDVGLLFIY